MGIITRIIGAIIMVHGDDSGLVLPPRIAPVQTRVIPIAQHKEGVLDKANELLDALNKAGYRTKIDDSEKVRDGNSVSRRCSESRLVSRSTKRYRKRSGCCCAQRYKREDRCGNR